MKLRTIIHVNEPDRWKIALGNITNLLNATGEDAEVIVVANGGGVKGYLSCVRDESGTMVCTPGTSDNISKMEDLSKRGVVFTACQNALKANNISPDELPGFVSIIPAGMVELIRRQAEGFAYIKP